jgi:hypothetical protein
MSIENNTMSSDTVSGANGTQSDLLWGIFDPFSPTVPLMTALAVVAISVIITDHIPADHAARFYEHSTEEDQLKSVFRGAATVICEDTATGKEYVLPIHNLDDYRIVLVNIKCRVELTP